MGSWEKWERQFGHYARFDGMLNRLKGMEPWEKQYWLDAVKPRCPWAPLKVEPAVELRRAEQAALEGDYEGVDVVKLLACAVLFECFPGGEPHRRAALELADRAVYAGAAIR